MPLCIPAYRTCGWNWAGARWAGSRFPAASLIVFVALTLPAQLWAQQRLAPGDYRLSLRHAGRNRSYLLHVPPAASCREKLPAVLLLHGGGGDAAQARDTYRLNSTADRKGFLAVHPYGSGPIPWILLTWNAGYCCSYAYENQIDDVGFLRALIEVLIREQAADPDRIYLTGMSNGGMMSHRLAVEASDLLAAVAPVAGSIGGSYRGVDYRIPDPPRPMPMMIFHGKKDGQVAYQGGVTPSPLIPGRIDLSVEEAVAFWVKANGCAQPPRRESSFGGNIVRTSYTGCRDNADVVLYTIEDGTHSWPGSRKVQILDEPNRQISANELMWEFFEQHPRRSAPPGAPANRNGPLLFASAASYDAGALSPGEAFVVFGGGFGPAQLTPGRVGADGVLAGSLEGLKILFDGAAAPLLYASSGQAAGMAPFSLSPGRCAEVAVEQDGRLVASQTVPVMAAGPGIFSLDASGRGPAAVLNQDFSLNSATQPARRGSVVMIYATGCGATEPPGSDGRLASLNAPRLKLPVSVWIDGERAEPLYAGAAPGLVEGILQINARVPLQSRTGPDVSLEITCGEGDSRLGVTLAVQ